MSKKSTSRTAKTNSNKRSNTLRRIAKVQRQSAKSITKLHRDTIEATREMVKETFNSQKQIASNLNVAVPTKVSEQIVKQSNEMTDDFERANQSNNQLGVRVQDAFTDYNNSMLNAWASYWGAQQQQFITA
jgi:uncharacterized membrane protein YgaE (UPF0421/DUF939 family)